MEWFVLDRRGRELGPMSEDLARGYVNESKCVAVRSEASRSWTSLSESQFVEERGPTVADLSPAEATKLLSGAIASGIFKASFALIGLSFLLGLLWQFLR